MGNTNDTKFQNALSQLLTEVFDGTPGDWADADPDASGLGTGFSYRR